MRDEEAVDYSLEEPTRGISSGTVSRRKALKSVGVAILGALGVSAWFPDAAEAKKRKRKKAGSVVPSGSPFPFKTRQIPTFAADSNGAGSTDWIDVSGSDLSITVARSSILLVSFVGSLWTLMDGDDASNVLLTVNVDGVDRTDLFTLDYNSWSGSNNGVPNQASAPSSFQVPVPVEAGTHTVNLRVRLWGNWGVANPSFGIGFNGRPSTLSIIAL